MSVVIETTIGDITVDLFTDERPVSCLNFMKLCKLKYYNYNLFHTVEQGFIAQSGDPTGAGNGGSSVWGLVEGMQKRFFEAESLPKIHHASAGLLSLVSAGKNLAGSQFFFTLGTNLSSLDGIHCVIGEVVEGHETLRALNESIVDENFRPYQDIRITHTVILDDPFPDPRGFQIPSRSPSPSAERLKNGRIAADEDIDDTDGKTMEEIQEMLADREAKARATILEIVGDLPDAEMAPPENVLFVCKLNPVTTDDDLEIIFSRFGKVKGCEVIRDKKSGDSLQYAFVEFEERKSCEAAYFKMDNVLIDDRRIHVDFSQSVAKVKWRGKGRGVEGPDGRIDFNNLKDDSSREANRRRNIRRGSDNEDRARIIERRPSMTSEERRKAREERHREQENRSRKYSRSRSRSRDRSQRSRYDNRYNDNRRYERGPPQRAQREGRDSRDNRRQDYRREERKRSRSREQLRKQSPERKNRSERRSPEQQKKYKPHPAVKPIRQQITPEKKTKKVEKEKSGRKKDNKKSKTKKSKRKATASSSSSESESETDSTSSDSASSTDSSTSSDDERRRKKKSKKSKKKKSKPKKKTKKHKK